MNFEIKKQALLGETLYKGVHKSGLTVYVLPKKDHCKSYAAFATNYGSTDDRFIVPGEKEVTVVPDGVAHFLEHKLFEQPDGSDAFSAYGKTGANANAFTSFLSTVYLFSSTDRFYENLEILLNFVSTPHFTRENVEKEQGIIGQEIRMYDDDPGWRVFFNMLGCLYQKHPVRKDIAGTVESIANIDHQMLYRCYNTFYNPSNMILFTCGNVDPDHIAALVDRYVTAEPNGPITRICADEPAEIAMPYFEQTLSVSSPLFSIGFKDTDVGYDGAALLKKQLTTSILLEMLFGESSDLYNQLYDSGLINDSFDVDCECERSYGFSALSGESPDPERLRQVILEALEHTVLSESAFLRTKKVEQGRFLRLWNSVEVLSNSMVSYLFKNIDIFSFPDVCESITFQDVQRRFAQHLTRENCVLSVIKPFEGKE